MSVDKLLSIEGQRIVLAAVKPELCGEVRCYLKLEEWVAIGGGKQGRKHSKWEK